MFSNSYIGTGGKLRKYRRIASRRRMIRKGKASTQGGLMLPGETHLGFREMSKSHLVTFQLMTKRFDIGETSKLCETSKLWRFVLTNQNVTISIVPFVPGVFLVLNLRSLRS